MNLAVVFFVAACIPAPQTGAGFDNDDDDDDNGNVVDTDSSGGGVVPPGSPIDLIDGDTDDTIDSFGTRMCVTDEGSVYVVWVDDRLAPGTDERLDVWLNRSIDGGATWLDDPVQVSHGNAMVWNPQLVCDSAGEVVVVWEDNRDQPFGQHQIYANRSTDDGVTFSANDVRLDDDPEGRTMSLEPQIASGGGSYFVTWYDDANGAYDIYVTRSGDGGATWSSPVRVDSDLPPGSAYSARPQIAASASGNDVWVLWEDARHGGLDVYFTRSATGGIVYEPDTRLNAHDEPGSGVASSPVLCTDGVAQVHATWHEADGTNPRDVHINTSVDAGDSWQQLPPKLDVDGDGAWPTCTFDSTRAQIAWTDNRNGSYDIFLRSVVQSIPSPEDTQLTSSEGDVNATRPHIAATEDGVAVAYVDDRSGQPNLYYNLAEPSDEPTSPAEDVQIDQGLSIPGAPLDTNFAVASGRWFAAWTHVRSNGSDILFRSQPLSESDP